MLGRHRLPGGAPPGTPLKERDDASVRREDGAVSVTAGHSLYMQLPGLGVDVQARRGGALRHRRAARSSAGATLHSPQCRPAGPDREGRFGPLDGTPGTGAGADAGERRPVGAVRHRDGDGG